MKITDAVKIHLGSLARANNGRITPDDVVADARKKDSPLHDLFEWDVKKAAAHHWKETARSLIRSVEVRVTVNNITVSAPVYVRDPTQETGKQGYIAVSELRRDHDGARFAIVNEFQRAADLLRRARSLAVALDIDEEVDDVISDIVELRDRVQHPEPEARM